MPETRGTSARGEWQRQEVVFETMDGQYARKVAVTFFNRPDDVKNLKEGGSYNVSVNIESREYNGRWYTDIRAWRVVSADVAAGAPVAEPFNSAAPQPVQPVQPAQPAEPQAVAAAPMQSAAAQPATADDVDDLPF